MAFMKNWTSLLSESLQKIDTVPARFKTVRQIQKETGVSRWKIQQRIQDNPKVEIKNFKIKNGNVIRLTPHYALK